MDDESPALASRSSRTLFSTHSTPHEPKRTVTHKHDAYVQGDTDTETLTTTEGTERHTRGVLPTVDTTTNTRRLGGPKHKDPYDSRNLMYAHVSHRHNDALPTTQCKEVPTQWVDPSGQMTGRTHLELGLEPNPW